MIQKHTQRPWKVGICIDGIYAGKKCLVMTQDNTEICGIRQVGRKQAKEVEANVRLITSARNAIGDNVDIKQLEQMKFGQLWDSYKELLKTCKQAKIILTNYAPNKVGTLKQLTQAIDKAERQ